MKSLRYIKKSLAIILAAAILLLSLAACSKSSPNLDLSQDDPFYKPSTTKPAEPSSDLASSESEQSDTYESDTDTETEIEIYDTEADDVTADTPADDEDITTPEETTEEEMTEPEETFPVEVDGLTFMYAPISGTSNCTINTVLGASAELVIPEAIDGYTVTEIASGAFTFAKDISSITLPATINKIYDGAFMPCTALQTVNISDVNAWLGIKFMSQSSTPMHRARQILLNGQPISEITIPEDVTEINDYAFYNFRSLNTVRFSGNVSKVGVYAF